MGKERCVAAAAEGSIEVNEVDPLRTLLDPRSSSVDRRAVLGLASCLALHEPYGLAR
jgi:hypothetical protein